ncbi:hypothetical protein SISSUDRAFT_522753 [Sistotremastrum suecicum HHB10207 ss-3]|uniref:Uncharacterized protein n=1 Tax=Sistotremastrum suecicum HHB10207 ss-3 TaxID=1314776 RepID=A0A165XX47_9AGAM|nr:hypothetical protein SISSUDRAFT_522753 [Sistotremastrum suecicum HHB10207 ss-3]
MVFTWTRFKARLPTYRSCRQQCIFIAYIASGVLAVLRLERYLCVQRHLIICTSPSPSPLDPAASPRLASVVNHHPTARLLSLCEVFSRRLRMSREPIKRPERLSESNPIAPITPIISKLSPPKAWCDGLVLATD